MANLRPILMYDGECRLCRFIARSLARLDRRRELAFLPLQDEVATSLLASIPVNGRSDTWRLVSRDGSLTGYGAGAPALLQAMRATRPLGRLLGRIPEPMLDRAYGLIARNRRTLGRIVPDGGAPRRYP
ncbi:MAG TPA: DUF393 domain-containing protein [Gaiellaceae bacterium]|nr:DUF393 domain-containing protein [Gaiellaceae bacterium]